jgi:hypothetical protein
MSVGEGVAMSEKNIRFSEDRSIDPEQAVIWKRKHSVESTSEAFKLLELFEKYECEAINPHLDIQDGHRWISVGFGEHFNISIANFKQMINFLRNNLLSGEIRFNIDGLNFSKGESLNSLVTSLKEEIKSNEIEQFAAAHKKSQVSNSYFGISYWGRNAFLCKPDGMPFDARR